jgi:aspartate racemase
MEQGFYLKRMAAHCGLEPMVPDAADRTIVHDVIFDELCQGVVKDESRRRFADVIDKGRANGADAVILGCTEIGLLISQADSSLRTFDSTLLHAAAAVDFADGLTTKSCAA